MQRIFDDEGRRIVRQPERAKRRLESDALGARNVTRCTASTAFKATTGPGVGVVMSGRETPRVPARLDRVGYKGRYEAAYGGCGDVVEKVISSETVETRLRGRNLSPRWKGVAPAGFSGLALDSRLVCPGDLFCAVAGGRCDGHAFLFQATESGAAAAVVENTERDPGIPLLSVTDTRRAAAHLAALFRGDPYEEMCLIGVTGTNGKTTTAWILRHLLWEMGPAAALGTLGSVGPEGTIRPGILTTPDPLALMDNLRVLREQGVINLAMEVSSHALDQHRVDALSFRAIAFTNLTREHLDYHHDMETYLKAKVRLAELLLPGGICAVNREEPAWEGLTQRVGAVGGRCVSFGLSSEADVRARQVRFGHEGSRWKLESPSGSADVELALPGKFNVQNALAAASVVLDLGLSPEQVAERLASVPPVPGRMEILAREPCLVLRDYAHTPDSFQLVLGDLRSGTEGRLIVVFGCGGERDMGKRPLMGRIASDLADLTFVTTDNPRSEDPATIAAQVVSDMAPERFEVVLDREEAITRALAAAGPDDTVALLGKGHETYQNVGERTLPFDEKKIVENLTTVGDRAAS